MNKDKLESLRRLAADERTPVEEARNAALLFVRGGGRAEIRDEADVVTREDFARARDQLAAMTRERDELAAALAGSARHAKTIGADLEKERAEATRLRSILTRLMDARKAEDLAGKVRAQAEQEARDALGGEEKKTHHESDDPVVNFSKKPAGATWGPDIGTANDYVRNPAFWRGRGW